MIDAPVDRVFDLSRSVEVHLLANVHWREQALAIGGVTSGLLELGQQVTWRAKHFGFWHNLTSAATIVDPPYHYQVIMTDGIFRSMPADHRLRSLPTGATELLDTFAVAAPLPILGSIAELLFLRRYMIVLNRERNHVIKRVAESNDWHRYLPAIQNEAAL